MQDIEAVNKKMTKLLGLLTTGEGTRPSILPGVSLMRADHNYPPLPVLYEPSIVIVAQGRKRGYLGGQVYQYDPFNYLVLSVPLPFEAETEATAENPMLGISVRADLSVLAELMLTMNDKLNPSNDRLSPSTGPRGICSLPLDQKLSEAIVRLLEHLGSPEEAQVLGSQTVREILYRVLCGGQGGSLLAVLAAHTHFSQISRVMQHIHSEYAQPLDITTLADEVNMSVSVFHRRFKEVTSTPPLHYIKTVRLHKARMLMVREGVRVGEAAEQVGYESSSQFSREFRRLFGRSPVEEVARVQRMLMSSKPAIARVE